MDTISSFGLFMYEHVHVSLLTLCGMRLSLPVSLFLYGNCSCIGVGDCQPFERSCFELRIRVQNIGEVLKALTRTLCEKVVSQLCGRVLLRVTE